MEFGPRPTMKSDCYRMRNATATRESSASRGSYYPDCRKDAQCNCEMCMDSMQATMDLRSPNNMCSSITDWSESPCRTYATPRPYGSAYSRAISSLYDGKENRCPKTEMSENRPRKENRRVSSVTVGSASKSRPDLSGYATDGGPVITERKKNILFGDATDTDSIRRKPRNLYGQVAAEPRKEMGFVGIGAHEESLTGEIQRKTKALFGDAADDGSMIAEMERKDTLFGDAADTKRKKGLFADIADDGSIRAGIERRNRGLFSDVDDDRSMTSRAERRNQRLLGGAVVDGSMIERLEGSDKGLLGDSADDGSMTASMESTNESSFGDETDDGSITAQRRKKIWPGEPMDTGPIIAERRRRRTKRKEEGRPKCGKLGIVLFLLLAEFILPSCLSSVFELSLTADKVKDISEESLMRRRLSDRLEFVARKLSRIVPGRVVNCTASDSTWKLQQDGLLVYSHCTLYSSMVEEVSLWGFPSQTAGVMGREITDRSFIIMSGRMIEWREGKMDYVIHQEGDSWTHEMLTASVVQMDGKTWILEYRPAAILQGGGLVSWALRFLKWRACGICERVGLNFRSFLLPKLSIRRIPGDLRTPT